VAAIYYWEYLSDFQEYGYLGVFAAAFLAGSSLPMPLPYIVVTFTLGGVSDPLLVGLVSGLGAGIGGTLVYLSGRGGRRLFIGSGLFTHDINEADPSWIDRTVDWARRRGSIVIFIMSALINPLFAPMAVAMGALKFRTGKFFLMCWAGNTVKSLFISYCGYFGLGALFGWLGLGI